MYGDACYGAKMRPLLRLPGAMPQARLGLGEIPVGLKGKSYRTKGGNLKEAEEMSSSCARRTASTPQCHARDRDTVAIQIRDELFEIVRRLRLGCAALLRTVTLCNVFD
jgi:hypothetical protein